MVNLFIDCNPTIQDCSLAYFQRMKNQGAKGAFIKVSEGQTWTTHTKGKSLEHAYNNSVQAGLMTGLYHFQRFTNTLIAIKEAQFFCKQLDAGGIGKQVKLMLDAEVAGASTATCIAFLQEMIRQGRTQLTTYTYKNFWQTVMDSHKLNAYGKIWLAGYKISSLGIDNVDAWQTADSWNGVS